MGTPLIFLVSSHFSREGGRCFSNTGLPLGAMAFYCVYPGSGPTNWAMVLPNTHTPGTEVLLSFVADQKSSHLVDMKHCRKESTYSYRYKALLNPYPPSRYSG